MATEGADGEHNKSEIRKWLLVEHNYSVNHENLTIAASSSVMQSRLLRKKPVVVAPAPAVSAVPIQSVPYIPNIGDPVEKPGNLRGALGSHGEPAKPGSMEQIRREITTVQHEAREANAKREAELLGNGNRDFDALLREVYVRDKLSGEIIWSGENGTLALRKKALDGYEIIRERKNGKRFS